MNTHTTKRPPVACGKLSVPAGAILHFRSFCEQHALNAEASAASAIFDWMEREAAGRGEQLHGGAAETRDNILRRFSMAK